MTDGLMQTVADRERIRQLHEVLDDLNLPGRPNWVDLSHNCLSIELVAGGEVYGVWRADGERFVLKRIRDMGDWKHANSANEAAKVTAEFMRPFLDNSSSTPAA